MKVAGLLHAVQLQTAIRERNPVESILAILRQIPSPLDAEDDSHNPLAIEIFSQTIFYLGSKTLTHARSAVAKYQPVFKVGSF